MSGGESQRRSRGGDAKEACAMERRRGLHSPSCALCSLSVGPVEARVIEQVPACATIAFVNSGLGVDQAGANERVVDGHGYALPRALLERAILFAARARACSRGQRSSPAAMLAGRGARRALPRLRAFADAGAPGPPPVGVVGPPTYERERDAQGRALSPRVGMAKAAPVIPMFDLRWGGGTPASVPEPAPVAPATPSTGKERTPLSAASFSPERLRELGIGGLDTQLAALFRCVETC